MSETHHSQLVARRILIIEDELLVAMDLEALLEDHQCEVLATVGTVAEAVVALGEMEPELVVLDLNLDGETTLPIAEQLKMRKIPFVVVSGYGDLVSSEPLLANVPVVAKPWNRALLLKCLIETLPPPES